MMKAFNRAYGVEETRSFIVTKLTALGLTLLLIVLLLGGALLLTAGGALERVLNLGTVGTVLLFVGRLVGAFLGMSLGLAILYWRGPAVKQSFVFISPGSLLATVGLVLFSVLFGLYVSLFAGASFNKTYGAIAGVIIFLFFLRIASTIILIGAEFNAEVARRYDPTTIQDKMSDPRKQQPGKQPTPEPQAAREAGVTPGQVAATNQQAAKRVVDEHADPTAASEDTFASPGFAVRLLALQEVPGDSQQERVRQALVYAGPGEQVRRARAALATVGVALGCAVTATLAQVARAVSSAQR
jgi:predicted lipid-binding transport protein (Tim44 family)